MCDEFEKLELNEENVLRILKDCRKTDATRKVISNNFCSGELRDKYPTLDFDVDKLAEHKKSIRYMLGQLHAVHTHKKSMSIPYGIMNYKGDNWTRNNMALFALYYLGTVSFSLPHFLPGNGGAVSLIEYQYNLKPTFWPPKEEDDD